MKQPLKLFAGVFLLTLLIVGCSKSDPAGPSIVGEWTYESYGLYGCPDPNMDYDPVPCSGSCKATFSSTEWKNSSGALVSTYTTSGANIKRTFADLFNGGYAS